MVNTVYVFQTSIPDNQKYAGKSFGRVIHPYLLLVRRRKTLNKSQFLFVLITVKHGCVYM